MKTTHRSIPNDLLSVEEGRHRITISTHRSQIIVSVWKDETHSRQEWYSSRPVRPEEPVPKGEGMKWEEISDRDKYQGCGTLIVLVGILIVCTALWGWIGFGGVLTAYGLIIAVSQSVGSKS